MDLLTHLPALQVLVPMLSAPIIVLLQPRGLAWAGATAVAVLSFAIAVTLTIAVLDGQTIEYAMGGWPAPYGIALSVDAFSALVLLVITGAAAAAMLAAKPSIDQQIEVERQPLFYSAWLLVLSGLVGIVVSADAFNIFVFMEISSLASYILIAGGPDRRALPAVFKYLMMGTIGATFYLIGVGLIYMMTGTLNLADMETRIGDVTDINPILVAAGFITIGLALKAAVFPMHVWVPNAYTHAPHMVTVFLAACATKVALYVLIRFDYMVFHATLDAHEIQFAMFMMPLAILGILIASANRLYFAGCQLCEHGRAKRQCHAYIQPCVSKRRTVSRCCLPSLPVSRLTPKPTWWRIHSYALDLRSFCGVWFKLNRCARYCRVYQ
jgi:multicomponent Na+:H+ antiporter subunit D